MKRLVVFLVIFLSSCTQYDQEIIITNITESQELILKANKNGNAHSIHIHGAGHIKGNAEIILMLNGNPYKTESLSGNVNFKWAGDWYSNNATVIYKAENVTEGNLLLEYNFEVL